MSGKLRRDEIEKERKEEVEEEEEEEGEKEEKEEKEKEGILYVINFEGTREWSGGSGRLGPSPTDCQIGQNVNWLVGYA